MARLISWHKAPPAFARRNRHCAWAGLHEFQSEAQAGDAPTARLLKPLPSDLETQLWCPHVLACRFVTFEDEEAVQQVFTAGNMHNLGGKQVEVKAATPKGSGPQAAAPQARGGPMQAGAMGRGYGGGRGAGRGYEGYGPQGYGMQPGYGYAGEAGCREGQAKRCQVSLGRGLWLQGMVVDGCINEESIVSNTLLLMIAQACERGRACVPPPLLAAMEQGMLWDYFKMMVYLVYDAPPRIHAHVHAGFGMPGQFGPYAGYGPMAYGGYGMMGYGYGAYGPAAFNPAGAYAAQMQPGGGMEGRMGR